MCSLKIYQNKNLKYELINKFCYNNIKELPILKKITLNLGCKSTNLLNITTSLLALELISNQKGKITTANRQNLALKIKKREPAGCNLSLTKKKTYFFHKILVEILKKLKQFDGIPIKYNKNSVSWTIKNPFYFDSLDKHYYLFNNLPNLNITIVTSSSDKKETSFILKSFKLPLKL